jgi:Ca-activated chloride channel family protein
MIRFSHPEYLFMLIFIPLILFFFFRQHRLKFQQLRQFAGERFIGDLIESYHAQLAKIKAVLFIVTLFLLIIALSGIQVGTKYEEVKVEGLDLIIALDISSSMNAQDVKPSRLEKARHSVINLLNRLSGDRVSLILFAGEAFVQCPLTTDYSAIRLFMESLRADVTTSVGTDFGNLIETIPDVFSHQNDQSDETIASRAMIIFSDGEDHNPDTDKRIDELRNITIFTVGVGSSQPAPIPIYNDNGQLTDYKRYRGTAVTTTLNETVLKQIAEKTGGAYYHSTLNETEIEQITGTLSGMKKTETIQYRYTEYEERYQFFLLPAILLLGFETALTARKHRKPKIFNA